MPQVATIPGTKSDGGGASEAWSNLPTMAKIGVIGGGLGLAVFLYNRQKNGGGGGASSDMSYGLPNTAIMLGSLQQGQLDIKGQIGSSYADLSNQMASDTSQLQDSIIGSNLSLAQQLDMLSAVLGQSFTNLQNNLIDNQTTNTNTIIGAVGAGSAAILSDMHARNDLLSQLIQGNQNATNAAISALSQSIKAGFDTVTAQQNAEAAAIGALGSQVTSGQSSIIQQLQGLQQTDAALLASLNQPSGAFNWSLLEGKKLYSEPDQGWYTVSQGKVMAVSFWDTVPNRPFGDQISQINVKQSLRTLSTGQWAAPN